MGPAEQVRDYANRHYVVPARAAKQSTVTFTAGSIHKALGFHGLMPCVCDALWTRSRIFETKYSVKRVSRTGPRQGATTTFTFSLA